MNFFQLQSLPGCAWPPLPDASLSQLWAAYLMLDRTQWLDPAEIERQQLAQARTLLLHCLNHVPYYRQLLLAAGVHPERVQTMDDFRRIPRLNRTTRQQRHSEFLAVQLPEGTVATSEGFTSGSSGIPLKVPQTNLVHFWWHAFYLRDLEWCGIDPTGTLAAIRATGKTGNELRVLLQGVSFPAWSQQLQALIRMGPLHGMDLQQDPRQQLAWLRRVNPDYLLSYPSNLEELASLLQEEGMRLGRLRAIQAISETLTETSRARIEASFGVPVKNTYSCVEAGYLASPCPTGHGWHVHAENVLFEVLDEQGQPCGPGQTGKVCLTTLHNYRAPFIRYELNDEVTCGPARCPCGRGLPLLQRIHGKVRPTLRLADGRLKSASSLASLISKVDIFRQYQIIQKTVRHIVVRLVPNHHWQAADADRVRQLLRDFFEAPVEVDLQLVERIVPPPHGKTSPILCEVPVDRS